MCPSKNKSHEMSVSFSKIHEIYLITMVKIEQENNGKYRTRKIMLMLDI